jgi:predicted NAD/FAD-dependent oxidoreductase
VIGAGVAGCALAAALRRGGWAGWIGLWEAGRGPGGRAATRRSRRDSALAIDHGAPLFNITTAPPPALLAPLRAGGWIEPWSGLCVDLDGEGRLHQPSRDPLLAGELWRGCGGMDRIAHGLLELAERHGPVERHWGHRVRRLARRPGGGWRLFDNDGEELAEVDWLVLSSSLLAHPRVKTLLGWPEVPLEEVAGAAGDDALKAAVAAIGAIRWEARSNLLLRIPAPYAQPWQELPFRILACDRDAQERWGLSRLAIQPQPDGPCAVVAHSSAAWASDALGVYGSESARAREAGALLDKMAEAEGIRLLMNSLQELVAPWIPGPICSEALSAGEGRLMRWGAAFPRGAGLEKERGLCPDSEIGFCGDFLAGSGWGRVEGALRSAEALAERLLAIPASASERGRGSAEADLGEDALAGEQFGGEADDEAEHGQAAIPGFGEGNETEAGFGSSHG